ncbi:four-carbon acid sugar kinase family protein [Allonocardiopsis opalescens]|uniref:Uncharacterized protein YgbK (DUF1537 family) n=1 Tax=Allonocardiopsis opalescens TaxID=1144618 RepID=A0A2T0Q794_9ACTN|nr:four-carbon acid sugar kinase family protein [Allonocardiopsis opalescens]PRX99688.1 uncharacterized protein YgbK (DUF1537 family) [Allonocardiopsis opalescens]
MSPVIAVVADDLTGAGDAALQFLHAGWSTELLLAPGASGAEVVAVSTDSRALGADTAAHAAGASARTLREAGARHLYKKVDSTLRGPVRAEIDAVRRAWSPAATAVVCPAFPAAGRTVRDGVLLVDGVPVAETGFGADPVTPVAESHVPTLLGAAHLRLESDDPVANAAALAAAGGVVAVDAEDDADLRRIAAAVARLGDGAIPVGSAGLAVPVARAWAELAVPAPVLLVVTSLHAASRAQVAVLAERHPGCVARPPAAALADDAAWADWCEQLRRRQADAEDLLVLTAPEERAAGVGSALVNRRFGALAAGLAAAHPVAGIVATGGDGARAVVDALGARGIALVGEVAAGIPVGTLVGGALPGRRVVTKAGGFGAPDALLRAAEAVRGGPAG